MSFDYKNSLTYPGTNLFGGNVNSNFVDGFDAQTNTVQKTKKQGLFGRDITNTPNKNNRVNNSSFNSRLNQLEKSKGKLFSGSSEESDSVEDSWEMDSDEENFSLSKSKLNKMPRMGFQSLSGYTSSGSDSPTRYDDEENYSGYSLSRGVRGITLEQNTSSEEYSGSSMDCVSASGSTSSSAASSSVKTNRMVQSHYNLMSSPTKHSSPFSNSSVSKKRTLDDFNRNPFDNGVLSTPVKEIKPNQFFSSQVSAPHEAPSKKRPINPGSFAYKALQLTKEKIFAFKCGDRTVEFQIGAELIGKGCYSEVYVIASSTGELVPKVANDRILFKRYHKDIIERRREVVEKFVDGTLEQYNFLSEEYLDGKPFPMAKIFNAQTAKRDGYFLVEKVPFEFNDDKDIDMKNKTTLDRLSQVKKMFQYAFDKGLKGVRSLDLTRQNVRINEEGKVVLIDYMEENQGKFVNLIEKHIETFAQGNEKIREYLLPVGYVKAV